MVIAVRPEPSDTAPLILVAAHDLAPGSPLRAEDVRQRRTPTDLVPLGALREPEDVTDRVLVGAARQGEPLTDVRLVNSSVRAAFSTGDSTTNVPLRLSDPEIGDYLYAGCRVDVVALSPGSRDSPLLAADARVVAIRSGGTGQAKGRLIVVELSRATAARVAAVALEQPVTVTLR
jgi:Flp pilus assembly protein CpaB